MMTMIMVITLIWPLSVSCLQTVTEDSSIDVLNNGGAFGNLCNWSYSWSGQNSEQQLRRIHKWASHRRCYLKLTNKEEKQTCGKSLYLTSLLLFYVFSGVVAAFFSGNK